VLLQVLCALQGCEFIVPVVGACVTNAKMLLIMEYAEGTENSTMPYTLCTMYYLYTMPHALVLTMEYAEGTVLYAIHLNLYTMHHTLVLTMEYAEGTVLYTVHHTLCNIHYTLYTMHHTLVLTMQYAEGGTLRGLIEDEPR
jgi:hypothetical protein